MASIYEFEQACVNLKGKITSIQTAHPTIGGVLEEISTKIDVIKSIRVGSVTSKIPTLGKMISDATAAGSVVGKAMAACPVFKEYCDKLDQMVDEKVLKPISDAIDAIADNPVVEAVESAIKEATDAIQSAQDMVNRVDKIKDNMEGFVRNVVQIGNMIRNPCVGVSIIAHSDVVGELNAPLKEMANHALTIIDESGVVSHQDISTDVQKKIVARAAEISGIELDV